MNSKVTPKVPILINAWIEETKTEQLLLFYFCIFETTGKQILTQLESLIYQNQNLNQHTKINGTKVEIHQNKVNKGKTLKKSYNE